MNKENQETTQFEFNGLALRAVLIDGHPWFIAADVCRHLGIQNTSDTLKKCVDAAEIKTRKFRGFRGSPASIVSEPGLYKLVLRAQRRNPNVIQFQDWVTRTVLPAIRKDGS
jgi:prophage antirepressor-like protein